jgi:hypothetical protein
MANEAFIRKYELKIGRNSEFISQILTFPKEEYVTRKHIKDPNGLVANDFSYLGGFLPDGSYRDFAYVPPKSITITDLHIEAEVVDNNSGTTQAGEKTTIKIYNLNNTNRDFIKVGNSVILKAGYQQDQNLPTIFVGQVLSVETTSVGEDYVTEIICDKALLSNQILINRTYPPQTTLREIIEDLAQIASTKGIPTGELALNVGPDTLIFNRVYPFGYVVRGNMLDVISKLCNENNLKSNVILGRLYIEVKNRKSFTKIINISEQSVKGSLEPSSDSSGEEVTAQGKLLGVTAKLFLDGRITTSAAVRITYGKYKGEYVVKAVTHSLSYESTGEWTTKIDCEQIKR